MSFVNSINEFILSIADFISNTSPFPGAYLFLFFSFFFFLLYLFLILIFDIEVI